MALLKKDSEKVNALQEEIKNKLSKKIEKDLTEFEQKIAGSAPMFKNTRVVSCSRVLQKGGKSICMAFNNGTVKPTDPNANKLPEITSFAADTYQKRDTLHAGMAKKPLSIYHPNAFRSRLPQPTVVMPYKNSSSIVIGDRSTFNRRQFVSTASNHFVKPRAFETSNSGIIAAQTIRGKYLQAM